VVAVAGIAAVVSYAHMQQYGAGHGEAWRREVHSYRYRAQRHHQDLPQGARVAGK
jgi:hypothetical protein